MGEGQGEDTAGGGWEGGTRGFGRRWRAVDEGDAQEVEMGEVPEGRVDEEGDAGGAVEEGVVDGGDRDKRRG